MTTRNKLKKVKQKVADVEYRCGGNYRCCMVMLIPDGLKLKPGEDVDITKFGISTSDWFGDVLPQWMLGFKYEPDLDHTLVEVQMIRDRKDEDVCVNAEDRNA